MTGRATPLALLDLAMPRDVDAAVHRMNGVRLVDIESLAGRPPTPPWRTTSTGCAASSPTRSPRSVPPSAPPASPRPWSRCAPWRADVVAGEMARLEGRLPGLDDKQRAEITQTVRRVVDKLLHAPTVRVKQLASEPGGAGYADALRTLFDLDPETVAAVSGRPDRRRRQEPQEPRARMTERAQSTSTERALRLGTRRSKLAMAQSGHRRGGRPAADRAPRRAGGDHHVRRHLPRAPGADRRHRRLRHRPARGPARRRGGLRGALPEGPAHRAARRPRPRRGPAPRGPAGRARRPRRAHPRPAARRRTRRHRLAAPHGAAQRVRT